MSRTDKDRPWWVVQHQERNTIDHDHRNGECIEETLETSRAYAHGRRSYRHHKNCRKYVAVEYTCTKAEPNRTWREQTCWTWVCDETIPDAWKSEYHACQRRRRIGCIGHTRREFDASIACVCDDFPPTPTCHFRYSHEYHWYRGGAPAWFTNQVWNAPERVRERDELRDFVKEYNANGGVEDGDFDNIQHRHMATWYYW